MNETETVSATIGGSGISMEELSAIAEWKSLGPNLKRLLTLALPSRNLLAAIRETHPTLDVEMQRQLAQKLLQDCNVQAVVNLYSIGVTTAAQSLPVEPVVPTPIPPVVDCGTYSDAGEVN